MPESLPFPFSDEPGISQVLDNAPLWALAFRMPEDTFFRQGIKRAAKKIKRNVGVLRIDDDDAIGEACLSLLRTQQGRKHLEHAGFSRGVIAQGLVEAIELRDSHKVLPDPDFIVSEDAGDYRSLDIERFRTWLAEHPINEDSRPVIAGLLCVYALLAVPAATILAKELSAEDVEFRSLIEDRRPAAKTVNASEVSEDDTPSSEVAETDGSVTDEPTSSHDVTSPALATEKPQPPNEITIEEWRSDTERRRMLLGKDEQCLRELESLSEGVRLEANFVSTLPWLRTPLNLADLARINNTSKVESEIERLAAAQSELARIMQSHTRAEALLQRLGRTPTPFIEQTSRNLSDLADRLDDFAQELTLEAEEISQVIEISRTFLQQVEASDARTAAVLCRGADLSTWVILSRALFDPKIATPEATDLRLKLASDAFASLLLARVAVSDRAAAGALIQWLAVSSGNDEAARGAQLFAFLSFTELCDVAANSPSACEAAALVIFAASLRRNRGELLEHLTPLIDSGYLDRITREFYRVLLNTRHRGRLISPASELRSTRAAGDQAHASQTDAETVRQRLLVALSSPPGLKRTFHRLRVYAQVQFLQPLRVSIDKRDTVTAQRLWQSFGDVDTMVDACIALLKPTDKPETRHYEQTKAYINDFSDDLERWIALGASSSLGRDADLARALEALHGESVRNAAAAAAASVVDAGENVAFPADDFAERLGADFRVVATGANPPPWIQPTMLASWPSFFSGNADLSSLMADTVRTGLLDERVTLGAAVETYLASNELEAAIRAARGNPELTVRVDAMLGERRQALCSLHAPLLEEAKKASAHDLLVAEYLSAAGAALGDSDFPEAEVAFELLNDAVSEHRKRQDPTRQSLVAWLAEAGVPFDTNDSTEELAERAAVFRSRNNTRNLHLRALADAATHARAAEPVRGHWNEAARQLDRPTLWPDEDTSALLAEAIAIIGRALRGKWQNRLGDADPSGIVVRGIAEWLPDRLKMGFVGGDTAAVDAIHTLADMLDEGCGDAALLRYLGALPEAAAAQPMESALPIHGETLQGATPTSVLPVRQEQPVAPEHRRPLLLLQMLRAETSAQGNYESLRVAVRSGRWEEVKAIAAGLARVAPPPTEDVQADLLALYGFAATSETDEAVDWLAEATAAVILSRRAGTYYLAKQDFEQFGAKALLRVMPSAIEGSVPERMANALRLSVETPANDPVFLQVADFFRQLGPVAPRFAEQIWMIFTGMPRNEQPRAALLRILFRLREVVALRHLVTATAVDKVRPLIRACLDAFAKAETQPEARPAAFQLAASVRDQATGIANTLPWVLLFHNLEGIRDESEKAFVEIELDSEFAFEDPSGALCIEVRIKPSLSDPPARLSLRLNNESAVKLFDEPIYADTIARVTLPKNAEFSADGEANINYAIEATLTATDSRFEDEGTWTIVRGDTVQPLAEWHIETLWPGAKRDPVLRNNGFFGREREIKEIESRLIAAPRARSVMLFGERRIGKTSIIRNLIATLPPSHRRVCGVFCDVAGLQAAPGELAVRFFERVATFMTNESDNGAVVQLLSSNHRTLSARELTRSFDPQTSLYTALEGLVRRLEELSNGTITRIALFVDEFDRFVVPMLGDRREEVNQLMWELRQVIQRSTRIALVLAGSGLQRLYKENYQDALYGSIDEVALFRFDWSRDHDAIMDTFLPGAVRTQLCRSADVERVTKRAAEICDGHPMFLALLGSAAAKLAQGRQLTPAFLDRVVVAMMRDRGLPGGETVERQVFYGFIFDQLEVITPREAALAKSLFALLAEQTLPDSRGSSLRIHRLLEVSGLLAVAETRELLQALDRLLKIDVIVIDRTAGRVRISVPLTAAAVREDAPRLREEAAERLRMLAPTV
jgi:hypothetical protein